MQRPRQERESTATETKAPQRQFLPGAIKRLFAEVKNALTPKAPAPEAKRKRREDTGRLFKLAKKVLRRAPKLPAEAYETATAYLWDTLDWLNQWHHHDDDHYNDDAHSAPGDHLYPHL